MVVVGHLCKVRVSTVTAKHKMDMHSAFEASKDIEKVFDAEVLFCT